MAKIKYVARENKKTGTHSFYAAPVFNGTLTTREILDEALDGKAMLPSEALAVIEEFMKAVKRNVLKGFRCKLGEDFLTIYPNIKCSVKDGKDKDGNDFVATAKMVTAANAKSRLGCTVSSKFSQKFAQEVSWLKTDLTGAVIEEEGEDITEGNENVDGGGGSTTPSGDNGGSGGGGGNSGSGGDME